jgi:protein-S-isoprenylcysteine O-methyltransferase Ste14
MPKKRLRLGSEHPLCDSIQLAMLISYFVVLGVDSVGHFVFGFSTVFVRFTSFPLLMLPALLLWSLGIYFALKSHEAVFREMNSQPRLIDSGVYSWVRHPMYLGILMFCLGFLFIMPSLLSSGVWIAFFIIYDRMASYEEKDLIHILGGEYGNYQKRVPKWFPVRQRSKSE